MSYQPNPDPDTTTGKLKELVSKKKLCVVVDEICGQS
jgi:hypothetical protein